MMNKAEKRELEIETLVVIFNYCEKQIDFHKSDVEYYENSMRDELEENPEYNCSYFLEQIEQNKAHIEAYKKVQDTIYKMM